MTGGRHEQIDAVDPATGLSPEDAAELRRRNGDSPAAWNSGQHADLPDNTEEQREALVELRGLLGGSARFKRIEQLDTPKGSFHVFHLLDPRTRRIRQVRLPSEKVPSLPDLLGPVYAATGETIDTPRRGSGTWRKTMLAITRATAMVEPADERDAWTWRVQGYLADRTGGDRDEACRDAEPFDKGGWTYIYAKKLQAHIVGVLREKVDHDEVIAGLRLIGFERHEVFYGPRDHRGKRSYWRAPIGWDDARDEGGTE